MKDTPFTLEDEKSQRLFEKIISEVIPFVKLITMGGYI